MAITFVAWGTFNASGGNANFVNTGGNVTPALPAGVQEGDLIVLFCGNRDGTNAIDFTSTGYTVITGEFLTNAVTILAKRAVQGETNPTVVTTQGGGALTNDPTGVLVGVFRGVSLEEFSAADDRIPTQTASANTRNLTTTATTGHNWPAISAPSINGSLIIALSVATNDYTTAPAAAGGFTINAQESTLGSDISMVAAYQIQTTAGAIAQGTFGGDTVSAGNTSAIAALKAAFPKTEALII